MPTSRKQALSVAALLCAAAWGGSAAAQPLSPVASPKAAAPATAGPETPISLAEAVALGVRDNRAIRSAYLERTAQKFDLVVARSQYVPRLIVVAGVTRDHTAGATTTTTTLAPTGTWLLPTGATVAFSWANATVKTDGPRGVTQSSAASLRQPLLRGAGWSVTQAPMRIAELQDQINQLGLKTTISNTVADIVFAYRALQQAQRQTELAEQSLARSGALLVTNRALIEAGRMAAADILQTQADVASQRVVLLQARQQRASAQLALLQLLSIDLRTNIIAADPVAPEHLGVDLDRLVTLALDNRMDVLAQRKVVLQDRESLRIAKNNRLWDLSAVAGVKRDSATGVAAALPETSSSVGLQLSIPIGDFTLKQAEVHADTHLKLDEVRLEDLRQVVEAQVRDAAMSIDAAWLQLDAAREARRLAEQALDAAREKLKAGRASNFEVLSFEASLRAAEAQELDAGVAYLNALTTLDQQVGGTLATWRIALNT